MAKLLQRHRINRFLVFLLLSIVLWGLTTLSEQYTRPLPLDVVYVNISEEKRLLDPKDRPQAYSTLKASGFRLMTYSLFGKEVQVDASKAKQIEGYRYALPIRAVSYEIGQQFPEDVTVSLQEHDTLFLQLGVNLQKKVQVFANVSLSFRKGYDLYREIEVVPDSLWVRGPENLVDTLRYVVTARLEIKDLYDSFERPVSIVKGKGQDQLEFSQGSVTISGEVGQFTEEVVEVPLRLINVPEGEQVKLFPEKVEVVYRVAFRDLKSVSPSDFVVVCDYKEVEEGHPFFTASFQEKHPVAGAARIKNPRVDYLIKKNEVTRQ